MPRFAANLGCAPLEPMKAAVDETEPIAEVARLPVPSTEVIFWFFERELCDYLCFRM